MEVSTWANVVVAIFTAIMAIVAVSSAIIAKKARDDVLNSGRRELLTTLGRIQAAAIFVMRRAEIVTPKVAYRFASSNSHRIADYKAKFKDMSSRAQLLSDQARSLYDSQPVQLSGKALDKALIKATDLEAQAKIIRYEIEVEAKEFENASL